MVDEFKSKDDQIIAAHNILASEAMMWLMAGSNHVEAQLDSLRDAYFAYTAEYGGYKDG